jgi:hypothetical protein
MKAKKLISIISAMSMALSVSAAFSSIAMAAPAESDVVSVAEVTKGFEFVYDKESSSATKKVVKVNAVGNFAMFSSQFNISFPSDVVSAVTFTQTRTFDYGEDLGKQFTETFTIKPAQGYANFVFYTGDVGAVNMRTDKSFGVLEFTTTEDKEFELVSTLQKLEDYDSEANELAGIDCSLSNITVPKYVTDPEPEPKPEAQAVNATMKHSQNDELSTENEAQYWLAEFTPTAAFNTLTVVATDVDGNTTAPVSKTETMVSGESSMFVQVLVQNVTKAVQSVVVTASVE